MSRTCGLPASWGRNHGANEKIWIGLQLDHLVIKLPQTSSSLTERGKAVLPKAPHLSHQDLLSHMGEPLGMSGHCFFPLLCAALTQTRPLQDSDKGHVEPEQCGLTL